MLDAFLLLLPLSTDMINYLELSSVILIIILSIIILLKLLPFSKIDYSQKAIIRSFIHKILFFLTFPILIIGLYIVTKIFDPHGSDVLNIWSWFLIPAAVMFIYSIWQTVTLNIFESIYGKDTSQTLKFKRKRHLDVNRGFNPHLDTDKGNKIRNIIKKISNLNMKGIRPSEWIGIEESVFIQPDIAFVTSKKLKNTLSILKIYGFYYQLDTGKIMEAEKSINELERNVENYSEEFRNSIILNLVLLYSYYIFEPTLVKMYLELLNEKSNTLDEEDKLLMKIVDAKISEQMVKKKVYTTSLVDLFSTLPETGLRKFLIELIAKDQD